MKAEKRGRGNHSCSMHDWLWNYICIFYILQSLPVGLDSRFIEERMHTHPVVPAELGDLKTEHDQMVCGIWTCSFAAVGQRTWKSRRVRRFPSRLPFVLYMLSQRVHLERVYYANWWVISCRWMFLSSQRDVREKREWLWLHFDSIIEFEGLLNTRKYFSVFKKVVLKPFIFDFDSCWNHYSWRSDN